MRAPLLGLAKSIYYSRPIWLHDAFKIGDLNSKKHVNNKPTNSQAHHHAF